MVDAVDQFDLSGFEGKYRPDGRGGAAYAPKVMVRLLLFAYCEGVRSSRQIERRCVRDVAYRVLAGNRCPDHATIARFRDQHQVALRAVFVQVLRLCAEAGLVRVGLLAVDGTGCRRMPPRSRVHDQPAGEGDRPASGGGAVQRGPAAGMLPRTPPGAAGRSVQVGRRAWRNRTQQLAKLKAAKQRLDAEAAEAQRIKINGERTGSGLGDRRAPRRGEAAEAWVAEWQDQPDRPRQPDHAYPSGFRQAFNGQAVVTSDQNVGRGGGAGEHRFGCVSSHVGRGPRRLDAARVADRSGRWWLMPAIPTSRTGPGLPRRAIARSCWWRCRVWARSRRGPGEKKIYQVGGGPVTSKDDPTVGEPGGGAGAYARARSSSRCLAR